MTIDETVEAVKKEIDKQKATLKRQRDEINVQAHLAKADIKDELDKLEVKYEKFQDKIRPFEKEMIHTNHEVLGAVKELGHEISEGYKRIIATFR